MDRFRVRLNKEYLFEEFFSELAEEIMSGIPKDVDPFIKISKRILSHMSNIGSDPSLDHSLKPKISFTPEIFFNSPYEGDKISFIIRFSNLKLNESYKESVLKKINKDSYFTFKTKGKKTELKIDAIDPMTPYHDPRFSRSKGEPRELPSDPFNDSQYTLWNLFPMWIIRDYYTTLYSDKESENITEEDIIFFVEQSFNFLERILLFCINALFYDPIEIHLAERENTIFVRGFNSLVEGFLSKSLFNPTVGWEKKWIENVDYTSVSKPYLSNSNAKKLVSKHLSSLNNKNFKGLISQIFNFFENKIKNGKTFKVAAYSNEGRTKKESQYDVYIFDLDKIEKILLLSLVESIYYFPKPIPSNFISSRPSGEEKEVPPEILLGALISNLNEVSSIGEREKDFIISSFKGVKPTPDTQGKKNFPSEQQEEKMSQEERLNLYSSTFEVPPYISSEQDSKIKSYLRSFIDHYYHINDLKKDFDPQFFSSSIRQAYENSFILWPFISFLKGSFVSFFPLIKNEGSRRFERVQNPYKELRTYISSFMTTDTAKNIVSQIKTLIPQGIEEDKIREFLKNFYTTVVDKAYREISERYSHIYTDDRWAPGMSENPETSFINTNELVKSYFFDNKSINLSNIIDFVIELKQILDRIGKIDPKELEKMSREDRIQKFKFLDNPDSMQKFLSFLSSSSKEKAIFQILLNYIVNLSNYLNTVVSVYHLPHKNFSKISNEEGKIINSNVDILYKALKNFKLLGRDFMTKNVVRLLKALESLKYVFTFDDIYVKLDKNPTYLEEKVKRIGWIL